MKEAIKSGGIELSISFALLLLIGFVIFTIDWQYFMDLPNQFCRGIAGFETGIHP